MNGQSFLERLILFISPVGAVLAFGYCVISYVNSSWIPLLFDFIVLAVFVVEARKLWEIIKNHA